ncbi:MarR family winged helix-turn-helix transcriptional regulator [Hoeflea sp.]|uniref:MarR family winged helix-turn-helix transcriptional regulator n=1 Tax=Hoeflea sp. TaxID=1940281 RepID=UPI003B517069
MNEQSIGRMIVDLARSHTARLNGRLEPLGLSQARLQVISALEAAGEQTQRELAEGLGVEQATMANTLGRLERDGLVVRLPHPDDRRAQLVRLTGRASELIAPAREAVREAEDALLRGLPQAEQALFVSMIARLSIHEPADETHG